MKDIIATFLILMIALVFTFLLAIVCGALYGLDLLASRRANKKLLSQKMANSRGFS